MLHKFNEGLRRRGDLTVWISEDALGLWSAPRHTTRGGQPRYSVLALGLCLTLGVVFPQPLRQTQGFMRRVAALLGVEIAVPDFSTLSRRGNGLALSEKRTPNSRAPIHLVVDSTGLKIFGEGALSAACCACACRVINGLTRNIKPSANGAPVASCTSVENRFALLLFSIGSIHTYFGASGKLGAVQTEVTIPPPRNAILSPNAACNPTARDRHITDIAACGRMTWQKATGYNRRSRGETLMGHGKAVTFTYLKVLGWGWFYLSTILDDYSRYIISWKLCTNMRAEDVTDTLVLALQASGCDQVHVVHKPRLLSDNGSSYVSGDLAEWLHDKGMKHARGAPYHPQTQGKIERWHQTLKNRILPENYFLPGDLETQIEAFVDHCNHQRFHESLNNVTPSDVYFGRDKAILQQRERIKRKTLEARRLHHRQRAA
ncbi:MAG: transposase InsO family protein [Paracoccaceae bacterium]|jgi:transposase InsO family protein